jgi:hypothetical protein
MWYTIEVMVERSDLSNLGDRGSAEKVSNLLGVQDPCSIVRESRSSDLLLLDCEAYKRKAKRKQLS